MQAPWLPITRHCEWGPQGLFMHGFSGVLSSASAKQQNELKLTDFPSRDSKKEGVF